MSSGLPTRRIGVVLRRDFDPSAGSLVIFEGKKPGAMALLCIFFCC